MKKIVCLISLMMFFVGNLFASVENFNKYQRASLDGVTVIATGKGILHSINLTSRDVTGVEKSGSVGLPKYITVYDNTAASGTVIAKIKASGDVASIVYDTIFDYGLTIDNRTSGDMTICYR